MDAVSSDEMLLAAIRRRLLDEIEGRRAAAASSGQADRIVNNVYGGGMGPGGLVEQLGSQEPPDDLEYLVDITRKDLPEINPETGKPVGWEKSVRRYTKKKVTE